MTNNKKLTPSEILRALADGETLCCSVQLYRLEGKLIWSKSLFDEKSEFLPCDDEINLILTTDSYIYEPPEKPKKLSELFLEDFNCYSFDSHKFIEFQKDWQEEVYNWLKKQEDDDN